jgi:hypothetical protein
MTLMRRIAITFFALAGIAALAFGGVSTALSQPAGPVAAGLLLVSATVAVVAVGLAARILYVLEHAKTLDVPHHNDR